MYSQVFSTIYTHAKEEDTLRRVLTYKHGNVPTVLLQEVNLMRLVSTHQDF